MCLTIRRRIVFSIFLLLERLISLFGLIRHSPDERPDLPTLKQHRSGIGREV
jgi:hypothetical protein